MKRIQLRHVVCWLLGHQWRHYGVSWLTTDGDPQCYLNDRCQRCREPRNPLIWLAQENIIRTHPEAIVYEA